MCSQDPVSVWVPWVASTISELKFPGNPVWLDSLIFYFFLDFFNDYFNRKLNHVCSKMKNKCWFIIRSWACSPPPWSWSNCTQGLWWNTQMQRCKLGSDGCVITVIPGLCHGPAPVQQCPCWSQTRIPLADLIFDVSNDKGSLVRRGKLLSRSKILLRNIDRLSLRMVGFCWGCTYPAGLAIIPYS